MSHITFYINKIVIIGKRTDIDKYTPYRINEYVCRYTYIYIYIYLYIYTNIHVYIYTYVYIKKHPNTCTNIHTFMDACAYVYIYKRVSTYTDVHKHTCIYTSTVTFYFLIGLFLIDILLMIVSHLQQSRSVEDPISNTINIYLYIRMCIDMYIYIYI
jgi:hypothetical protein